MPATPTIVRVLPLLLLLLASCGDEEKPVDALACYQNSDCKDGLVCTLGRCRLPCKASKDCGGGGSCITDGVQAVCQSLEEKNTPCDFQKDCLRPLSCASDYRCRNMCTDDDDCNVFDIEGRRCARDMHGKHYCAEPKEVQDGLLISTPPEGATGDYTPWPDASFTSPEDDASIDGGDADSSPDDGGEGDAFDDDVSAPKTCDPGCPQSKTCLVGECVLCGSAGEACCDGTSCKAELTCTEDQVCACGGANQACCGGESCEQGLSCDVSDDASPVCACGALGTRCCPGEEDAEPMCEGDGVCAGSKCSCIAELAQGFFYSEGQAQALVRRVDGSVWQYGTDTGLVFKEVRANGARLKASAIAVTASYNQTSKQIGCAVVANGEVLCFPSSELADSTWLGAGLGANEPTSAPVKVVLGIAGAPLTGVTQLAGRPYSSSGTGQPRGPTFCAVTDDGAVWCWGWGAAGELGRGDTTNSSFARQVITDQGTPFDGAAEVRVGYRTACARRHDGSVWCWGGNAGGELGVLPDTLSASPHPVRVAFAGSGARTRATHLSFSGSNPCVIMEDTSVVCWGWNNFAQAGDPAAGIVLPTTIVRSEGGSPLTGVIDVADHLGSECVRDEGLDVLCWGWVNKSPYPSPLRDASNNAVVGVRLPLAGAQLSIGYVDATGLVNFVGIRNSDTPVVNPAPLASQPPCTDP